MQMDVLEYTFLITYEDGRRKWDHQPAKSALPPPIPDGWRIWANDVEVAGVNHRIDIAIAFAQADEQSLRLEPERTNLHGECRAVKVLGSAQRDGLVQQYFLGYVPKDIAASLPAEFQPRIKNISVGGYHAQHHPFRCAGSQGAVCL